jgi:tetratricopeptide (TPR) repeat protein
LTQAYVFLAKTAEENRRREEANEWSIKGENAARKALSISNLDEKSDLDEKDRQKAYSLIGDSLLVRGKYDQAIEAYNEARKINPKDAFLALYIADAYNESLNRSKAIEYMQIAEKLAKNDPQLENEAATAHFNKNTKKIMERLGIH